jgi:7,8-dihydropterin-6-yl-methyl-4-(beta-D-ribofuranosyl)aminobenzene 5'-phosphate synthase
MKKSAVIILLAFLLLGFTSWEPTIAGDCVTITILYDNYAFNQKAKAGWGFSSFIQGLEKTVLFDAGGGGDTLSRNAELLLSVQLSNVDLVVLSHDHWDHTGGLSKALGSGSKALVYFGNSFSEATEQKVRITGATVVQGADPVKPLPTIQTTGEMQGEVNEQALIISVDSGLVVITGCSHPGVIQILERAKQVLHKNIYMVLGGFHWLEFPDSTVNLLIKEMKDMGVRKCGATHCTGERAIALIKKAFGSDFVEMGVGRVITLSKTVVDVERENGQ